MGRGLCSIGALKAVATVVAAIAGLLFAAPLVAGVGYGLGGYIPYGVVCQRKDDLFSGAIQAEDYQVFLMNRGCNYEKAVGDILSEENITLPSGVVLDIIRGRRNAANADEVIAADLARSEARTFKWPKSADDCPPGEYCAVKYWWTQDIISDAFAAAFFAYMRYFAPTFSYTIFSSSSSLIGFTAQGPIFCAGLFIAYAALLALLGFLLSKLFGHVFS